MINLTFTVDNITTVRQVYNRIRVQRAEVEAGPFASLVDAGTGISSLSPEEIELVANQSVYNAVDYDGETTHWYRSQYYFYTTVSGASGATSSWSSPVLGEAGEIYYNPLYPPEIAYGSSDRLVIDRIRLLIGDRVELVREYGEDAASSIHPDNKTYELDEKGWPANVMMNSQNYNTSDNPTINGYKYLIFQNDIDITAVITVSGVEQNTGVDIWCYTFRHSDREIMDAYDTALPPPGLTEETTTQEAYMLVTAIDLLMLENWQDAIEDGAKIVDEGSRYDPTPGFDLREFLLDKLRKRLDSLVRQLTLGGIHGVRID